MPRSVGSLRARRPSPVSGVDRRPFLVSLTVTCQTRHNTVLVPNELVRHVPVDRQTDLTSCRHYQCGLGWACRRALLCDARLVFNLACCSLRSRRVDLGILVYHCTLSLEKNPRRLRAAQPASQLGSQAGMSILRLNHMQKARMVKMLRGRHRSARHPAERRPKERLPECVSRLLASLVSMPQRAPYNWHLGVAARLRSLETR